MLNKAFGVLKDRAQAEKALCEAFAQIWKNIGKIDDPRGSQALVFAVTIAKNCAYALMADNARGTDPTKDNWDFDAGGIEEALYVMPSSAIIKVVNKLGGENKNIFLLKYTYGLSMRKIAGTLNEAESNIAVRLRKAQRRLRALLLRGDY